MSPALARRKLAAVGITANAFGLFSVYCADRFLAFDCPAAAWHAWKQANPAR